MGVAHVVPPRQRRPPARSKGAAGRARGRSAQLASYGDWEQVQRTERIGRCVDSRRWRNPEQLGDERVHNYILDRGDAPIHAKARAGRDENAAHGRVRVIVAVLPGIDRHRRSAAAERPAWIGDDEELAESWVVVGMPPRW